MHKNYWRCIPTIPKLTPWRLFSCSRLTNSQRHWTWQSWPSWRARWRVYFVGIHAAPSTSRERISLRRPNACRMRWGSSLTIWALCVRLLLYRFRWGIMWIILPHGLPFWSRNRIWSKIGPVIPLPIIWYMYFYAEKWFSFAFQVSSITWQPHQDNRIETYLACTLLSI